MRNMLRNGTLVLALVGSAAFLANPSFAVEPDTDPPAGPELVAPHGDPPNFQLDWACCDDQTVNDVIVVEDQQKETAPPQQRSGLRRQPSGEAPAAH
jgi:hypothetical protein